MTQAELAQMANLSRSVVGQHLEDMERTGILRRQYALLQITDLEALRRKAGVDTIEASLGS